MQAARSRDLPRILGPAPMRRGKKFIGDWMTTRRPEAGSIGEGYITFVRPRRRRHHLVEAIASDRARIEDCPDQPSRHRASPPWSRQAHDPVRTEDRHSVCRAQAFDVAPSDALAAEIQGSSARLLGARRYPARSPSSTRDTDDDDRAIGRSGGYCGSAARSGETGQIAQLACRRVQRCARRPPDRRAREELEPRSAERRGSGDRSACGVPARSRSDHRVDKADVAQESRQIDLAIAQDRIHVRSSVSCAPGEARGHALSSCAILFQNRAPSPAGQGRTPAAIVRSPTSEPVTRASPCFAETCDRALDRIAGSAPSPERRRSRRVRFQPRRFEREEVGKRGHATSAGSRASQCKATPPASSRRRRLAAHFLPLLGGEGGIRDGRCRRHPARAARADIPAGNAALTSAASRNRLRRKPQRPALPRPGQASSGSFGSRASSAT